MTAGVPKVSETYRPFRLVSVSVVKAGPLPDPDNLAKNLLDGMTNAGLLVNDSGDWCRWNPPQLDRVPKGTPGIGTVIVIDDWPAPRVRPEQTGPNFTRSEIDRRPYYKELVGDPADFSLFFDPKDGAGERLWLSYPVCDRLHLARLVAWCEAIGVPKIEETVYSEANPAPTRHQRPAGRKTLAESLAAFD